MSRPPSNPTGPQPFPERLEDQQGDHRAREQGPVEHRPAPQPSRGRRVLADPEALTPRLRRRRAFTLVGLTFLVPGSAQIVAGHKGLGRFGLRVWFTALLVVVAAVLLALVKRNWLLGFAARPWLLFGLATLCALLGLVWLVAFADAARLGKLPTLPAATRRGVVLLTVLGMALTAGPLGWAASSLYAGGSVLGSIFSAQVSRPPVDGRYNILLLGGDSGADRIGTRPDTIMLASVDASTGSTVTFGFARDTENIDFRPGSTMARLMPEGWNCGDQCLLNGLYMWGTDHKDRFPTDVPDPGALATKEAVEALSGLDIQYYALIDLEGFQAVIDAVGGIDVITKTRVPIGGGSSPIYSYIEPGRHHFDGFTALWYARSREGSTNYERMARQKCVLQAATKKVDPQTVILTFRDLAAAGVATLRTDVPQADLGGLADLVVRSRNLPMKSVNFTPPLINPWDYDPAVIRDTVARVIAAPQDAPPTPRVTPSTGGSSGGERDSTPTPGSGDSGQGRAGGGAADSSKGEQPIAPTAVDADICTVP